MGIEAIGRGISIAPSIGRVAPAMGALSFGPRFGVEAAKVAMTPRAVMFAREFSPIRIPRMNPPKPQMKPADVIAEAELIVRNAQMKSAVARSPSEVRMTKQSTNEIVTLPLLESRLDFLPRNDMRQPSVVRLPNPIPKVEAVPQRSAQSKTEGKPVTRSTKATPIPFANQVYTEQMVSKVIVKEKKKEPEKERASKKESRVKIKIVEALRITRLRKLAILDAVRKVKEEAEQKGEKVVITGKKIKRFLTVDFWKYLSPLVRGEGHDGTIQLTLNALDNNQREYTNLEQAQTELSKPVIEHIPLEIGEEGRVATIEEVREVLTGKEKENLRIQTPAEVVVIRLTRENKKVTSTGQAVNTLVEEKEEVAGEPNLKSLGLEELFPKAA